MFMLARRRRENERRKKMDDAFTKADENGNGMITPQQMVKLFEANDCTVPNLEEEVEKLADKDGWIKRADYVKFTSTTDLFKVEFHDRVFQKFDLEEEIDKKKGSSRKEPLKRLDPSKMDRVELAFRKFDTNNDGYLSREEFDQMMKNVDKEQADRIFRTCDTSGDNRISLEEFRAMLDRGKDHDANRASKGNESLTKVSASEGADTVAGAAGFQPESGAGFGTSAD